MTPVTTLLLIMGVIFVAMVFGLRYYAYKTMTERVCSRNPDSDYCRRYYQKKVTKTENLYKHCDVIYGETPSGGVKTVICYVDDHNKMAKKKGASKVLVRELDRWNRPVYETWTPLEELQQPTESSENQ